MSRVTAFVLLTVFAASAEGAGGTLDVDPHILKERRTFEGRIFDPYEWTLIQLADGPITGSAMSDYARIVVGHGLKEAHADIDGDGTSELLLRGDAPARAWQALVFKQDAAAFRYLGSVVAAYLTVVDPERRAIMAFEPCGGHFGYIREYQNLAGSFVLVSSEGVVTGDGAPEVNTRRVDALFPSARRLKWEEVVQLTADRMPQSLRANSVTSSGGIGYLERLDKKEEAA